VRKLYIAIVVVAMMAASANAFIRTPLSFSGVVKKTQDGVVNISTTKIVKRKVNPFFDDRFFKDFFGDNFNGQGKEKEFKSSSLGSGFVIDKQGHIVTNNHVIKGASEIIVKTHDQKEYKAKVIGRDPLTDLAIIKIEPNGVELKPIDLGDSANMEVGDWVVAIGNPLGLSYTVTAGILSAKGRIIGSGPYDSFLQTDASINPGNSGGPLLNVKGEVIGINTAIIPSGQGLGFAIPVNMLKELLPKLMKGSVDRGWLGVVVQPLDKKLAKSFGIKDGKGALIAQVVKGDPAEKAGIKAGDVVVKVNGKNISDSKTLINIIGRLSPGEEAVLTVIRNGDEKDITVKLGRRDDGTKVSKSEQPKEDGPITVKNVEKDFADRLGIPGGALVINIDTKSNAYKAGLRRGDVVVWMNRTTIKDVGDFNKVYGSVKKGSSVILRVLNRNGAKFLGFDKD